ncbi:MAG: TonB-dependent receptor [Verrucomicrobia bacterium]|nr:TonB-dependent receptor [Verrucomicrobiota bacterium]
MAGLASGFLAAAAAAGAPSAPAYEELLTETQPGVMIQKEREVRYKTATAAELPAAVPQPLSYDDWLRTLNLSRATVRLNDRSHLRLSEFTRLEIRRPPTRPRLASLVLHAGAVHVTSRGRPQTVPFVTPHVRAVPTGTEFVITVDGDAGQTEILMFDGEAELSDGRTNRTVRSGQQGIVAPGRGIVIRPLIEARNLVQWWIYYPGVLDLDELEPWPGNVPGANTLRASVAAYRDGDLVGALERYPGYPEPVSAGGDASRTYLAALFLAVGAVDRAQRELALVHGEFSAGRALRMLIRAVQPEGGLLSSPGPPADVSPATASELLALSYAHQGRHHLDAALRAARAATRHAPAFAFAWARVGELEFSFGRTRAARAALERALVLAPRHAQAHALRGFLLAADNRLAEAMAAFDTAIALDPALGNAWLGRGLCKRRATWAHRRASPTSASAPPTWLDDIQTAAALEPRRSLCRSYAGKAFADAGLDLLARRELEYARHLDPQDPTPWLYSALLEQEHHRNNRAVAELERSIALNDNRAVYRSALLLDEDRAVRSSSLAHVYHSAGLADVSRREAARAVSDDYANYSAHLFLADSYNLWRDPTRFYLRYETPWFSELLLANLLAPAGATPLSAHISQQEYSRLFTGNRIGLLSATTCRSDGQLSQIASQFGNAGNTAWSLDLDFQHNDGSRPNNGLDRIEWYSTFKQQLSPRDSVLLLAKYQDYRAGDNFQYFDATNARPYYRFDEFQSPILLGGYHREWAPGIHTLLLGARLHSDTRTRDRFCQVPLIATRPGRISIPGAPYYEVQYDNTFEAYTAELNQIVQTDRHLLNLGARFQSGTFDAWNSYNPHMPDPLFVPFTGAVCEEFERMTAYGYYSVTPVDTLVLQGGLAYDRVRYPETIRNPPVTPGTHTRAQFSPKAAVVWTPVRAMTLRGAYSQSLGGVSFDQSFRLEPTHLAGFVQTYRELFRLGGAVSAAKHETAGSALDLKLGSRTYAGIELERLEASARRRIGATWTETTYLPHPPTTASSLAQELRHVEYSAVVTLNQLVGRCGSFGARYSFNRAESRSWLPEIPPENVDIWGVNQWAELHRAGMFGRFHHPSGVFLQGDLDWYWQKNWRHYLNGTAWISEDLPHDSFPHLNLAAGWRFPRQRGAITVGILNLTDTNYHLNPLNFYPELPHERVFYAQLQFRL